MKICETTVNGRQISDRILLDESQLTERWYPIQVKQKDKVGRRHIEAFQTAMRRSKA